MTAIPKILIIDDDDFFCRMLSLKLRKVFPFAGISTRNDAKAQKGYDVYIIDNDFDGACEGARLAERLGVEEPNALIVMLSGSLDQKTLMRLVNCQTNAVFDKCEEQDLVRLTALIDQHLASQKLNAAQSAPAGSTLANITRFIDGWSRRLDMQESQ